MVDFYTVNSHRIDTYNEGFKSHWQECLYIEEIAT